MGKKIQRLLEVAGGFAAGGVITSGTLVLLVIGCSRSREAAREVGAILARDACDRALGLAVRLGRGRR